MFYLGFMLNRKIHKCECAKSITVMGFIVETLLFMAIIFSPAYATPKRCGKAKRVHEAAEMTGCQGWKL